MPRFFRSNFITFATRSWEKPFLCQATSNQATMDANANNDGPPPGGAVQGLGELLALLRQLVQVEPVAVEPVNAVREIPSVNEIFGDFHAEPRVIAENLESLNGPYGWNGAFEALPDKLKPELIRKAKEARRLEHFVPVSPTDPRPATHFGFVSVAQALQRVLNSVNLVRSVFVFQVADGAVVPADVATPRNLLDPSVTVPQVEVELVSRYFLEHGSLKVRQCQFDLFDFVWSFCSPELKALLQPRLSAYDDSGLDHCGIILLNLIKIHYGTTTAAHIRKLTTELTSLRVSDIPGEDIMTFNYKFFLLVAFLMKVGRAVPDVDSLFYSALQSCSVTDFRNAVTNATEGYLLKPENAKLEAMPADLLRVVAERAYNSRVNDPNLEWLPMTIPPANFNVGFNLGRRPGPNAFAPPRPDENEERNINAARYLHCAHCRFWFNAILANAHKTAGHTEENARIRTDDRQGDGNGRGRRGGNQDGQQRGNRGGRGARDGEGGANRGGRGRGRGQQRGRRGRNQGREQGREEAAAPARSLSRARGEVNRRPAGPSTGSVLTFSFNPMIL